MQSTVESITASTVDDSWTEWDKNQAAWKLLEARDKEKNFWIPLGGGGYRRRKKYQ